MNYNLKGTGLSVSGEMRAYVDKKLAPAEKFLSASSPVRLDIELEFVSGAAGPKYSAEYTLVLGKKTFRAQAQGTALHEVVDIASDELVQELARAKDKRQHLFRRGAARIKDYLRGFRE